MPQHFIYETAVSIDHETGECRVDTTREGIAAQLRRAGFLEVTQENSKPYRRFLGEADQIKFRKPKSVRTAGRTYFGFASKKNAPDPRESVLPEKSKARS